MMKLCRTTNVGGDPLERDHVSLHYEPGSQGTAAFRFAKFGHGEERTSNFIVTLTMADIRLALDEMVINGSREAKQLLSNEALAKTVRKAIRAEKR